MIPTYFLMLREGLEAALIVGIIAAYLARIGRRDMLPMVAGGVAAAVGLSVVVGVVVVATVGRLPVVVQETLEGLAGLAAVAVLTWMLFWMRRQGRALKGELEHGVDAALGAGGAMALVALAFVAVARDGLETVLFLLAVITSAGAGVDTLIGGLLGLATAVGFGLAIFVGGARVNLRQFFTVTGVVLIFVAAGLLAFAVGALGEAGLIVNSGTAYNLNGVLPDSTPLGNILRGLFGYRSQPTPLEVVAYLLYLVPVLTLFVVGRPSLRRRVVATG
jgi:high-affinity iron transporter